MLDRSGVRVCGRGKVSFYRIAVLHGLRWSGGTGPLINNSRGAAS
jgi:hypothetical protein